MIRRAKESDCLICFQWRNKPEFVALSTSQRTVAWPEHKSWFAHAIKGMDVLLYIVNPYAGTIRLDRINDDEAVISISLLKEFQGRGLGQCAIHAAVRKAFNQWEIKRVIAYIRNNNEHSIKAFRKAGFSSIPSDLEGHGRLVSY